MTDTQTSNRRKVGDKAEGLVENFGGIARAATEATTEASVGAIRVATDLFAGFAKSFGDTLNKAVSDSTDVAQSSVRRLFSLDDRPGSKAEARREAEEAKADARREAADTKADARREAAEARADAYESIVTADAKKDAAEIKADAEREAAEAKANARRATTTHEPRR